MAKKKNKQQTDETIVPLEPIEAVDTAEAEKPSAPTPSGRMTIKSLGDLTLPAADIPITLSAVEPEPIPEAPTESEPTPTPAPEVEPEPEHKPEPEPTPLTPVEAEIYETSEEVFREAGREGPVRERHNPFETLRTGGSLLLICAVVALVVSFVNAITADVIAERIAAEQQAAIGRIFGGTAAITEIEPLAGAKAVYAVGDEGYCVSLDAKGFGGKLDMMIGIGRDGVLRGVEIVSHRETPGFGDRAATPDYLAQYAGMGAELTLGREIVAVSGATISSRGVIAGVNAATAALIDAGLIEVYHAPPPSPELTEEERLQAELDALMEELGITPEDDYSEYEEGYDE